VDLEVEIIPHHVGLSVPDLEASAKWYQEILGFSIEKRMEIPPIHAKIVWLKAGEFRVELFQMEGARPLPDDRRIPNQDLMTQGWKHLSLGVKDVRQTVEALKKRGVDIAMESVVEDKAMAFIRDNAGNLIEINQIGEP